jgi:hypothetical protein
MTSARQQTNSYEDIFEVYDILGKFKDSHETGGPIPSKLLGSVLLHANTALERTPNEKDAAIVEAVELYYDAKVGNPTIMMPSSLLGELVQICSVEVPSSLELQRL